MTAPLWRTMEGDIDETLGLLRAVAARVDRLSEGSPRLPGMPAPAIELGEASHAIHRAVTCLEEAVSLLGVPGRL